MKKEPITVGAWETDEQGRRFRRFGNSVEYAMQIMTTGGTVYEDDLTEHNKQMQAQKIQQVKDQQAAEKAAYTGKNCPVKSANGGMIMSCEKSCAFYENDACSFADMIRPATRDTKDYYCPITNRKCLETCAMYNEGCTLTIFRERN